MRAANRVIGVCLIVIGCDSATSPRFAQDGFIVEAARGQVTLTNQSDADVHFVLVEEETSALVDLYFDPQEWPKVGPGATHRVAYEEILGYSEEATHVRVYWWTRGEYREYFIIGIR